MPKAMVQISEKANRVLNILKAKYALKDKSQAINKMAEQFNELLLEPQLRPEYVKKLKKIEEEETVSEEEFKKMLKDKSKFAQEAVKDAIVIYDPKNVFDELKHGH